MTQLTVYRNKDPRTRVEYPYLLNVQSDLLGELNTRVVIPRAKMTDRPRSPIKNLMPPVPFDGFLLLGF